MYVTCNMYVNNTYVFAYVLCGKEKPWFLNIF